MISCNSKIYQTTSLLLFCFPFLLTRWSNGWSKLFLITNANFFFCLPFLLTRWSAGIAKSTRWCIIYFFAFLSFYLADQWEQQSLPEHKSPTFSLFFLLNLLISGNGKVYQITSPLLFRFSFFLTRWSVGTAKSTTSQVQYFLLTKTLV